MAKRTQKKLPLKAKKDLIKAFGELDYEIR